MVREPMLTTVPIADLRPTQLTVGMREVEAKRKRWREIAAKEGGKFLGKHMIPTVLGPKVRHYVVDHHHLARALHDEGVKDVAVTLIANLSTLEQDEFWTVMDDRSWMYRFDSKGQRRHYEDIRKRMADLVDDPFRSLAGELRRAGGFAKGHHAIQRISLGRFPAPAHEAQNGRARLRARRRKSDKIGQE